MSDEGPSSVPEDPSLLARRPALGYLMKSCAAAWAVGMGIPAGSYLWPALHEGPGLKTLNAVPANEIPVGGFKLVQASGKPIIVIRSAEKKYEAFSAICTHLGCLVTWRKAEKDIFCPCHGGRYDLQGKVLGGPPPRPLTSYPVSVVGGEVEVKLSAD